MCLSILLQAVPVAAAENDTLNTWQLSNVKLEHTSVEFQLSGVESVQDASDTKAGTSIAYINGVKRDEEFKKIRLMN